MYSFIGASIVFTLLFTWTLTYLIAGERLFGQTFRDLDISTYDVANFDTYV